jgi:HlyD family secretion protein
MAQQQIFRQAALDRLSSPEQLDQLVQVTTPKGWIALIAACSVLLAATVWSVMGRIPTTISGGGILIKSGGIYDIDVLAMGVVSSIDVAVGDEVEAGQVIALVAQPQLQQQLDQARAALELLHIERADAAQYSTSSIALETASLERQQESLTHQIDAIREQIKWLEQQEQAQREALDLGVITRSVLQNTIQSVEASRGELARVQIQLQDLDVGKLNLSKRSQRDLDTIDNQILEAERHLQALNLQLAQSAQVKSPYSGQIQEIRVAEGQMVQPGTAIVSLEKADTPLQAVGFISMVGQKVSPGLIARIAPATVKREEYGYVLGRVKSVSGLPTTRAGMMRLLNNDLLVQQLVAQGAPFAVEVELEKDAQTHSGFRWSSGEGPPVSVESGTLCEVSVVVSEQRPISLVIPALRRLLLGEEAQFPKAPE